MKPRNFLPPFLGLAPLQPPAVRGAGVRAMLITLQGPPSALPQSISSFSDLAVPSFYSLHFAPVFPTPPSMCLHRSTTHKADGFSFGAVWEPTALRVFLQKLSLHPPVIKTFNHLHLNQIYFPFCCRHYTPLPHIILYEPRGASCTTPNSSLTNHPLPEVTLPEPGELPGKY